MTKEEKLPAPAAAPTELETITQKVRDYREKAAISEMFTYLNLGFIFGLGKTILDFEKDPLSNLICGIGMLGFCHVVFGLNERHWEQARDFSRQEIVLLKRYINIANLDENEKTIFADFQNKIVISDKEKKRADRAGSLAGPLMCINLIMTGVILHQLNPTLPQLKAALSVI